MHIWQVRLCNAAAPRCAMRKCNLMQLGALLYLFLFFYLGRSLRHAPSRPCTPCCLCSYQLKSFKAITRVTTGGQDSSAATLPAQNDIIIVAAAGGRFSAVRVSCSVPF